MTRPVIFLVFLGATLGGTALYHTGWADSQADSPALKSGRADPPDAADSPAGKTILANVRRYMEAFNRHDAAGIAELFSEDCDITEVDGTRVRGRKELADELKETFAEEPTAKISVAVEALIFVT